MADQFDVIVIGGGPGGYVCAIRAAQLGFKVACVEKRETLGGTCLNVGCIPSKALLQSSEKYEAAKHHFAEHGIDIAEVKLDLAKMQARKDSIVAQTTKGIDFLFRKNKIEHVKGHGRFTGPTEVTVAMNDGSTRVLQSQRIVIAVGSEVATLPGMEIDEQIVVSSTGALALEKVPGKMVVVGAGVIGLELGSVWRRLGAEVTVVEYLDRITPGLDNEVAKELQKVLTKQGMSFKLGTKVVKIDKGAAGATLTVEPAAGGAQETINADVVLVAIGRRPYTEDLGLDKAGVALDAKGRVAVHLHEWRTNVPTIWAIGDAVDGPMLAHKAEEEGVAVAEILAGKHGHVNYDAIPGVIYTSPEVASVGKSEEEAKAAGIEVKIGKFPFAANARARANGDTTGFVKFVSCARTDQILGVHMIGPDVGTMIAELALAIEFKASSEDVYRTCHAHPTLNEVIKEAALAVDGRPLHM